MSTRRSIVALSMFTALGTVVACSSGDPYDLRPGSSAPTSAGWVNPNGGYDASPSPSPGWHDAGAWDAAEWEAGWSVDTGTGWAADAGADAWAVDSGSPWTGNAGSCGNPLCAGDGFGDCGCYATDSQGNAVTLGCSGGACGCFVNQEQTDDDVESVGACDSNTATAQAFIVSCSCD